MPSLPALKLINVGLRGSTLLSKFSLLFFLAYFLEPSAVALYGLVAATVAYSIYGLGFDFYSYSTRELLGTASGQWMSLVRDQGVFFVLMYLLVLPLLLLVFVLGLLPWSIVLWFVVLVVLEHLAQEINRLLVAMGYQLLASIVLFLRSGVWAALVALVFWCAPSTRSLDTVFLFWCLGSGLACGLGGAKLLSLDKQSLKSPVDWRWIKRGIIVAVPLLIATLSIRGVFTIDRYWMGGLSGDDALAAYVLYAGIANAIMSFLDAGVFVFLYPKLVSAFKNGDQRLYRKSMKSLLLQTVWVSLVLAILAGLLIYPLLMMLDNPVYSDYLPVLYLMLVAITLNALSMVPHYGMYAMSYDRGIIVPHIVALLVFISTVAALSLWWTVYAVPMALIVTFGGLLLHKTWMYHHYKKKVGSAGFCFS